MGQLFRRWHDEQSVSCDRQLHSGAAASAPSSQHGKPDGGPGPDNSSRESDAGQELVGLANPESLLSQDRLGARYQLSALSTEVVATTAKSSPFDRPTKLLWQGVAEFDRNGIQEVIADDMPKRSL